ncbi:hypothetical protein DFH06DRAFT_1145116 [Mycena polygramma]|nr:hypothetical protein DFH06DRAFT_1145116 [Mycena polygramma]
MTNIWARKTRDAVRVTWTATQSDTNKGQTRAYVSIYGTLLIQQQGPALKPVSSLLRSLAYSRALSKENRLNVQIKGQQDLPTSGATKEFTTTNFRPVIACLEAGQHVSPSTSGKQTTKCRVLKVVGSCPATAQSTVDYGCLAVRFPISALDKGESAKEIHPGPYCLAWTYSGLGCKNGLDGCMRGIVELG